MYYLGSLTGVTLEAWLCGASGSLAGNYATALVWCTEAAASQRQGPSAGEDVLGKRVKLNFLGSQGTEESVAAVFSPEVLTRTDLGCEPSDEENGVQDTQRWVLSALSPHAGERLAPATGREKGEEEKQGRAGEETENRKEKGDGGGGGGSWRENAATCAGNGLFRCRRPCLP